MSKRKRTRNKLYFLAVVLFIIFIGLGSRVGYLKSVHGAEYETLAKTQQVSRYDSVISPNRGTITDRNNQPLAISTTVYNIILDVRVLVMNDIKEQEKTITALSQALEGVEYETLKEYITIDSATGKPNLDTSWKILAKAQSREIKEALEEQKLKGVIYDKDTKRRYPAESMGAKVIGFMRDAMWGLEKQYNEFMSGVSGRSFITYNEKDGAIAQEIPAEDGNTIVTTLDYTIQSYAEESVNRAMKEYSPEFAGTIVMDPNTGEIFAMASAPNFNLNDPATPIALSDEEFKKMWDEMTSEEQYEYLNETWKNFNISSTFEPGSTFKPIVVAAAIEEGIITNSNTYFCGGSKVVADKTIRCHLRSGHGTQTVEEALANSCNVAMMEIGAKMGKETLYKYMRDFGFHSLTGIDLPNEASANSSAVMYTPDRMGPVELATMSFGQSFGATPLQSLNAMAAAINGGNLMRPYVVSQVVNKNGSVIKENRPELIRKVISQETSDIIRHDLIATVENGTGKKAKIAGYTYGAKTGTGQQGDRTKNEHSVSFIGYLPAENPQFIVMTYIQKPESYKDGVTSVSPIIKEFFEKLIKYKGIEPTYEVTPGTVKDNKKVMVEQYVGGLLFEVLTELEAKNLQYEIVGKGNKVVNQVPKGLTEVLEGTKVTLYVEKEEDESGGVIVPDVKGKSYEDAVSAIIGCGLEAVISGEEEGVVIKTEPLSGVTVEAKSEVKIIMGKSGE